MFHAIKNKHITPDMAPMLPSLCGSPLWGRPLYCDVVSASALPPGSVMSVRGVRLLNLETALSQKRPVIVHATPSGDSQSPVKKMVRRSALITIVSHQSSGVVFSPVAMQPDVVVCVAHPHAPPARSSAHSLASAASVSATFETFAISMRDSKKVL